MQFLALLWIEKCIGRKKYQPGPTLAVAARHLGQSQMAVGKWTKARGVILNRPRCSLAHRCFGLSRRRLAGHNELLSVGSSVGRGRPNLLNFGAGKVSF